MSIKTSDTSMVSELPKLFEENARHSLCLDFKTREGRVYGFAYAHLLNYLLEKNPDFDGDGKKCSAGEIVDLVLNP